MHHRLRSMGIWPLRPEQLRPAAFLAVSALVLVAACESECRPGQIRFGDSCRPLSDFEDAGAKQLDAAEPAQGSGSTEGADRAAVTSGAQGVKAAGTAGSENAAGSGTAAEPKADAGTAAEAPATNDAGSSMGGASDTTPACPPGTSPAEETCDGQDNDCDGITDEGVAETPCGSSTQGICHEGKKTCSDGSWTECLGAVEPETEVCDAEPPRRRLRRDGQRRLPVHARGDARVRNGPWRVYEGHSDLHQRGRMGHRLR